MTSWLEPLGRDRARRRAGRPAAGEVAEGGERNSDTRTDLLVVPSLEPQPSLPLREPCSLISRCGPSRAHPFAARGEPVAGARPLEPAGGIWPAWGPRRARWPAARAAVGSQAPRQRSDSFRAIFAAMNASIVRLDTPLEPDVSTPAADRLLVGVPEHRVWNYFTDSTQTFFAGRWSGTRGKWRVRYTENELCVMTAGRVVITSDSGERSEFGPGAAFVIPSGFTGTWEVLEDCEKVYAIFEPRT